jgi:hypothetical protein
MSRSWDLESQFYFGASLPLLGVGLLRVGHGMPILPTASTALMDHFLSRRSNHTQWSSSSSISQPLDTKQTSDAT